MDDMLKLNEAGKRLDVPTRAILDMIDRGELVAFVDDEDGQLRVRADDVRRLAITRPASR
jgi:hypothetical protein